MVSDLPGVSFPSPFPKLGLSLKGRQNRGLLLAFCPMVPGTRLSPIPDSAVRAGKQSYRSMTLPPIVVSGVRLGVVVAPS